jgi:flagellar protein FlaG
VKNMPEINSNLNVATQPQPAVSSGKPGTPAPTPTTSIQDVGRDLSTTKGESIKQLNENMEDIKAAVSKLNAAMKSAPTSLQFSVDSASHRFIVSVTDKDTGELVRTMPGDAILRIAKNLESLKGVLFDELY